MMMEDSQKLFGLPSVDGYSELIQQQYCDTCAIKSQEIVMHGLGFDVDETQLVNEAFANGWYTPGAGTPMEDVGKLLELHGIDVSQTRNNSLYNLVGELAKGNPVIVGVDSGELWESGINEVFEDVIIGPQADHALIVGGIEFNDNFSSGTISVIDPGTGDYCKGYDLNQFTDAWADSGNFMLTIN